MKAWLRLTLTGLVAYLVFLVFTMPAAPVVSWLSPAENNVRISGVSGTLWSGQALAVETGKLGLQDLQWHFRPMALFTGALEFALSARLGAERVHARAGVSLLGNKRLTQVQGRVSLDDVLKRLAVRQVATAGLLQLDLDKVLLNDGSLPLMEGSVSWKPARIVAPVELDLGGAELNMHMEGDGTVGDLEASGGQLLVQGKVELNADGQYKLDSELRAQGDVPPQVAEFLSTFTEYRNGVYRLEWSDTWNP
jgi:general secretion pathway protein N